MVVVVAVAEVGVVGSLRGECDRVRRLEVQDLASFGVLVFWWQMTCTDSNILEFQNTVTDVPHGVVG